MGELVSYSPATKEAAGTVRTVEPEELPGIIERSRKAQSIWSKYPKEDKIRLLKDLSLLIADNCEEYGRIVHADTGKPKAECINTEMFVSSSYASYCADWLNKFKNDRKIRMDPINFMLKALGRSSRMHYDPAGVVAVISPFNFPMSIPFTETATAVAAGNSVILKPSSDTPLTGDLIQKVFREAGFPEDLVITVHGRGVGKALSQSEGIDRIVFTGGTDTGRSIAESASKNLVPVTLELGGCDSMVILKDADIDRSVKAAVWGAFTNAGQVCVGVQRILVHDSIYDEFKEKFVSAVKSLKVGCDWDDPDISVGPVINERAMEDVLSAVKEAEDAGGKILCGGKRADIGMSGYFIEPTVVENIPLDSGIYAREVFGPYTTLARFSTEDEAIEITNSNRYALGGSVWTRNAKHGYEVASRMDSGNLAVNNLIYGFGIGSAPWGGCRESGFGKSHGEEGFLELMNAKHIHSDKGGYPNDPWWMPYSKESTDLQVEMTQSLFGHKKGVIGFFLHALPIMKKKN